MNAARPPYCRYSGRMSGVFGQHVGPEVLARRARCVSSVKYSVSSCLVLRQVK